jgi:SAM-dependent methyltransferase
MSSASALSRVQKQWTILGESDPLWAVLTRPEKRLGGWDEEEFFETGVREIAEVIENARRVSAVRFGTAVDFGCGVGRLSQALAEKFECVIGVDIAESMIREASHRNRFPDRCRYIHNTAANLTGLETHSADFVYSNITLQHVVPQLAHLYIQEFFRIARPGALVIFQLPSRPSSPVKHWVKGLAPVSLTNLLWRLRTGSAAPIESYFTPEAEVAGLVESSGGLVVLTESNQEGPPGWESRKYFCVRT